MYASLVKRYGGTPEATIIGTGEKVSLYTAALINSGAAHRVKIVPSGTTKKRSETGDS